MSVRCVATTLETLRRAGSQELGANAAASQSDTENLSLRVAQKNQKHYFEVVIILSDYSSSHFLQRWSASRLGRRPSCLPAW